MIRSSFVPFSCALALSTLSAPIFSQTTPQDAWRDFVRQEGANWTVQWNAATGTPSAIYGPGLDLPGEASTLAEGRRRALATLDRYADLLGRGSSSFVEDIASPMGNVWTFVYKQRFGKLDVIGGRADVRVHKTGGISLFGSAAFPIPADFDTSATVGRTAARAAAYRALEAQVPVAPMAIDEVRLVIWGDVDAAALSAPRLAWDVRVRASEQVQGNSYVDAKTGAVLRHVTSYHECKLGCSHAPAALTAPAAPRQPAVRVEHGVPQPGPLALPVTGKVQAWTNTGLLPTAAMTLTPLRNVRVQIQGGNSGFTDNNGDFSIAHNGTTQVPIVIEFIGRHVLNTLPQRGTKMRTTVNVTPGTPASVTIYTPNASEDERAQVTAYWGSDDVNTWMQGLVGGALPALINSLTINTSLPRNCNAFYSGGRANSVNYFVAGGGCNMTAYSTVVQHEWGHAIDNAYGGISQTDGLSEGWGDLLAIYRTGQPVVGAGFRTSGGAIRTALNTLRYPAQSTSVHTQGQTWMGFAWDLRENLRVRNGSAGVARAEKIVVPTLAANARNQPDAVREVFIADDDDNNLDNGTPNYVDLEAAALKRTLPFPKKKFSDPGAYTSYGAGCVGTGSVPSTCVSINTAGNLRGSRGFANIRYMLEIVAQRDLAVQGFEIKQSSRRSGSVTVPTFLYNATAAGQPGTALATGTMSVGSAAGFYSTRLNRVVNIRNGQRFFIGFQNAASTITVGTLTSGTVVPYWRNNGSGGSWIRFTTRPWAYRVSCATSGGAIPALTNSGSPVVGVDFSVDLAQAKPSTAALLVLGASDSTWSSVPLPLDLTAAGANGCSLLASAEYLLPAATDAAGSSKLTISVPNDLSLHRTKFFNQYIVIDSGANALGLAFSNGGAGILGKQ